VGKIKKEIKINIFRLIEYENAAGLEFIRDNKVDPLAKEGRDKIKIPLLRL
jgi:hypothetical protein